MRPSLSPMLVTFVCSWVSVRSALYAYAPGSDVAAEVAGGCDAVTAAIVTASAVVLCMGLLGRSRFRMALVLVALGVLAGWAVGSYRASAQQDQMAQIVRHGVGSYEFLLEEDPKTSGGSGWTCRASAYRDGVGVGGAWLSSSDWAEVDAAGLRIGTVVRATGSWGRLGGSSFDTSLFQRGVVVRVSCTGVEPVGEQGGFVGLVRSWRAKALDAICPRDSPSRALLCGVCCGMQSAMRTFEVNDDFKDLGLSHLVAVSGSHLAVFCALLELVSRRLRMPMVVKGVVVALVLGIYVLFTGIQPSAVRAWIMVVLSTSAWLAGRRAHGVTAVCAAALSMVLANPNVAAEMGYELSVLSVLGLTVFAPLAGAWVEELLPRRIPRIVCDTVAATLVSQLATMPIVLPAFGVVSFASPLANMVVGPMVSALLIVGLVAVPLVVAAPWAASFLFVPVDALGGVIGAVCSVMVMLPLACVRVETEGWGIAVATVLVCAALYVFWPRPSRKKVCVLVSVVVVAVLAYWSFWRYFVPERIVFLDVGQGDAILVQDCRYAVLIDTGPGDALDDALAREHVTHLDAVVLTHTDADHTGGLSSLGRYVDVDSVVVGTGVGQAIAKRGGALLDACEKLVGREGVLEVGLGESIVCGSYVLDVLWPLTRTDGDDNEDSLVLLARYEDGGRSGLTVLLTGDAESQILETLCRMGLTGPIDVLKVGHHGSAASVSKAAIEAIGPSVAVASAGRGNRYGHPDKRCTDLLEEGGVLFYCTIQSGDIEVRPGVEGFAVECRKGG